TSTGCIHHGNRSSGTRCRTNAGFGLQCGGPKHPEARLQKLRFSTSSLTALTICTALGLVVPLQGALGQAQRVIVIKKKTAKKTTPAAKEDKAQERAAFSLEDEGIAVVAGIPDARIWGDSA